MGGAINKAESKILRKEWERYKVLKKGEPAGDEEKAEAQYKGAVRKKLLQREQKKRPAGCSRGKITNNKHLNDEGL